MKLQFPNPDPEDLFLRSKDSAYYKTARIVKQILDNNTDIEKYVPTDLSPDQVNMWNASFKYWQLFAYLVRSLNERTVRLDIFKDHEQISKYVTKLFEEKKEEKKEEKRNNKKNYKKNKKGGKQEFRKFNPNQKREDRRENRKEDRRDDRRENKRENRKEDRRENVGKNFIAEGANKVFEETMKNIKFPKNNQEIVNLWGLSNAGLKKFLIGKYLPDKGNIEQTIKEFEDNLLIKESETKSLFVDSKINYTNEEKKFVKNKAIKDPYDGNKKYGPSAIKSIIDKQLKDRIISGVADKVYQAIKTIDVNTFDRGKTLKDIITLYFTQNPNPTDAMYEGLKNLNIYINYYDLIKPYITLNQLGERKKQKKNKTGKPSSDGKFEIKREKVLNNVNKDDGKLLDYLQLMEPSVKKEFYENFLKKYSLLAITFLSKIYYQPEELKNMRDKTIIFLIAYYSYSIKAMMQFIKNLQEKYRVENVNIKANKKNENKKNEVMEKKKNIYIIKIDNQNKAININKVFASLSPEQKEIFEKIEIYIVKYPKYANRLTKLRDTILVRIQDSLNQREEEKHKYIEAKKEREERERNREQRRPNREQRRPNKKEEVKEVGEVEEEEDTENDNQKNNENNLGL